MNLDQTTAIRIAIRDTTGAIARQETPEPTRAVLQTHLDALLKEELRALTGQALVADLAGFAVQNEKFAQDTGLRKDPEPPIYENLWLQAARDLDAAMDLVQQNQEFFGAQCGDDKIKVIGEFFVKWAAVMTKPEWIDWAGGARPVAADAIVLLRFRDGRETKTPISACYSRWEHLARFDDIVRYRVCA